MSDDEGAGTSPLRRRARSTAVAEPPPPSTPPSPPPSTDGETRVVRHRRQTSRRYLVLLSLAAVVAGLVVGLIAGFATKSTTPTFQSQALLEIDQPHALAISADDGVIAKLSRLRFKYAGLMRTQTFAQPIATKLNLPVGLVAGSLYSGVDPETLVIAVGAKTHNRTQTQQIAVAAAQELIDYTKHEQAQLKIPVADEVTFTLVTPASPAVKVAPTHQRIVLVALGAFVFVTAGTLAFGYLWRRDS
jgi:capsular polysaccharide biosynthesis protein